MRNHKIRCFGNTTFLAGAALMALALATACSDEELISDLEPDQNQALHETDREHRAASEQVEATAVDEIRATDGVAYTSLETLSGDVAHGVESWDPVSASDFSGKNMNFAEPQGSGARILALTAREFKAKYCPGGYDFLYCWPDTSGNPWVQRTSTYFCGAVAATNCTIRFRYQYYDGGWKTFKDMKASPGQHYWFCMSGSKKTWRLEILDNENCGLRFSVWGKN
jgi:hypothetical protein